MNVEHEQCHHHNLLMSIYSLHSDDTTFSQRMMEHVMGGSGEIVQIKTKRERQQRWLVNQRYTLYVISLISVHTNENGMCLVAWGIFFANFSRSDWKHDVGKEIVA